MLTNAYSVNTKGQDTPPILVTVQPFKQAFVRPPLRHQIDVNLVGVQEGLRAHFALLIDEHVDKYLHDRAQAALTLTEVKIPVHKQEIKQDKISTEHLGQLSDTNRAIVAKFLEQNRERREMDLKLSHEAEASHDCQSSMIMGPSCQFHEKMN